MTLLDAAVFAQTFLLVAILLAILRLPPVAKEPPRPPVIDYEHEYVRLSAEVIDRQLDHEREHAAAHPRPDILSPFSPALQREAMSRRLERKIHEAGLPPLSHEQCLARFKEPI